MDAALMAELAETNKARAEFCRFLASIYLYELTDEQIESFAHLEFEHDGSKVAQGYGAIVEYLRHRNRATRQELAVDYAHTFLGAGEYNNIMAPPYESVFTSKARLLMQGARDGALAYYRSEQLDLPPENTTPEDHLGFELQFQAEIIDRSTKALTEGDDARASELFAKQRSFLRYHQENWLPAFCDAIDEHAQTDFYRGVADLTRGYLQIEREVLDDIAAELGLPEEEEVRSAWMDDEGELQAELERIERI